MKKTILFLFAAVFAGTSAFGQQGRISGKIEGWGNDRVIVQHTAFSGEGKSDTLSIENGEFTYSIPQQELLRVRIHREKDSDAPASRTITLWVAPGDRMQIEGTSTGERVSYRVEGSALNDDLARVDESMSGLLFRSDSLLRLWLEAGTKEEGKPILDARRQNDLSILDRQLEWVRRNPTREAAGFFLLLQPVDTLGVYYPMLSEVTRNGPFGSILQERWAQSLNKKKPVTVAVIGQPAPDFTLTDIEGKPFAFSGYDPKGKYTILDFWGSWCGPCIAGFPKMKAYYAKHRDKLEIIGIACHDKEVDWKKAVDEHTLPWIQLFNGDGYAEDDLTLHYAVGGFPTYIILSPDKTVLFNGDSGDFYEELDELLK